MTVLPGGSSIGPPEGADGRATLGAVGGLEGAYRMLLQAYPASWRAHREDEVLSVLMMDAEHGGRRRPGIGESVNLVLHGLGARLDALLSPMPHRVRDRVALLALICGAAVSVVSLTFGELRLPGLTYPGLRQPWHSPAPFFSAGVAVYVCWIASALLHLTGRPRAGRGAVQAAGLLTVSLPVLQRAGNMVAPPLYWLTFLTGLTLLTVQGDPGADGSSRRARTVALLLFTVVVSQIAAPLPWLLATLRGDVGLLTGEDPRNAFYRGSGGLSAVSQESVTMVAVALIVALVVSRRHPGWDRAVTVTALPWLYLWAVLAGGPGSRPHLPALLIIAAGGCLICTWVGYLAGRRLGPMTTPDRRP